MKTSSKFLYPWLIATFLAISIPHAIQARMISFYPIWGYQPQEHICQIKQASNTSPINTDLNGAYWDIRECRRDNPQIIFYTGRGIFIWAMIFSAIFLFHYTIFPRFKEYTEIEKTLSSLKDMALLGIVLFFVVLFQHYFAIPQAVHDYPSDIDHIIYSTFINPQIPLRIAIAYLFIILMRLIFIKNKKPSGKTQ